ELMLPRPDVRAVAVDHERQIAEQLDAVGPLARALPLRASEPLQVLIKDDLVGKFLPGAIDRRRLTALELDRPFGPRPLALARVQRAKQAVVLDPPRLLAGVGAQRPRPHRVAAPLPLEKSGERSAQRRVLQPAHGSMV